MSAQDPVLAQRYGDRSRSRRPLVVGVLVVIAAAFLAWVVWVGWVHGNPSVSSQLQSFEVPAEHRADARVRVWLDDDAEEPTCTVRAMAFDHSVVGEVAFTPRDGLNEVSIRTDRKAVAVEMVGCTAVGQSRAR